MEAKDHIKMCYEKLRADYIAMFESYLRELNLHPCDNQVVAQWINAQMWQLRFAMMKQEIEILKGLNAKEKD